MELSHVRYLQTVMETVLDGLIIIDSKGRIETMNTSAVRIFGYTTDEVSGKNVSMLMPEPYRSEHDGYLSHYHNTGEKKVIGFGREILAQRKDGSVFPMELGVNEMEVDGRNMYVGTIRDISQRKEAEKSLQSYIQKLTRSNEELDQFAYIASHDLKEPLRGLFNNATFLQEDYDELLGEPGKKRINRIQFLCSKMEQLIDDLLQFSRLGRVELAVEEVDLGELVHEIRSIYLAEAASYKVNISLETPLPGVRCDRIRVKELLRNLVSNGLKYNDHDVREIAIGCAEKVNPRSRITERQVFYVRDNGIGIPAHFHDDIFRIFKRLAPNDATNKGTGVGLTFVKRIVERHMGEIWLESDGENGSCFYFTLSTPNIDEQTP